MFAFVVLKFSKCQDVIQLDRHRKGQEIQYPERVDISFMTLAQDPSYGFLGKCFQFYHICSSDLRSIETIH